MCEICSRLTIKTPERQQRGLSGVFIVNFEHISYMSHVSHFSPEVFPLLASNK